MSVLSLPIGRSSGSLKYSGIQRQKLLSFVLSGHGRLVTHSRRVRISLQRFGGILVTVGDSEVGLGLVRK